MIPGVTSLLIVGLLWPAPDPVGSDTGRGAQARAGWSAGSGSPMSPGRPWPAYPHSRLRGIASTEASHRVARVLPEFAYDPREDAPKTLEVLYLAKARPVRMRIRVHYQGKPLEEAWASHLRKQFDYFDRDRDGRLDEAEYELTIPPSAVVEMLAGTTYAGLSPDRAPLESLDRDGDQRLSFAEYAVAYREAAQQLVTVTALPAIPAAEHLGTENLFRLLDTDKNGKLSRAEIGRLPDLLKTHDRNQDDMLTLDELQAGAPVMAEKGMMMPAKTQATTEAAPRRLDAVDQATPQQSLWIQVNRLSPDLLPELIKRYDTNKDKMLSPGELGLTLAEQKRFDANADGKLDKAELLAWLHADPPILTTWNYGATVHDCRTELTAPGDQLPEGMEIRSSQQVRSVLRVGSQLMRMSVAPGLTPTLWERYLSTQMPSFPGKEKFVTEESLIGPRNQALLILMDAADQNSDGRLTPKEYKQFRDFQRHIMDLGLQIVHAERMVDLFDILDENSDGRLNIRELRTAWDRLIVLEPSQDKSAFTREALQPSVGLRLSSRVLQAAQPQLDAQPFQQVQGAQVMIGPLWFQKMDRNQDGDLTLREFLGSEVRFRELDLNGDGLISAQEAIDVDRKYRPEKKAKK